MFYQSELPDLLLSLKPKWPTGLFCQRLLPLSRRVGFQVHLHRTQCVGVGKERTNLARQRTHLQEGDLKTNTCNSPTTCLVNFHLIFSFQLKLLFKKKIKKKNFLKRRESHRGISRLYSPQDTGLILRQTLNRILEPDFSLSNSGDCSLQVP